MSKLQIISDKNKKSSSIKNLLLNKIKSNQFKKENLIIVIGGDGFMLQTLKRNKNSNLGGTMRLGAQQCRLVKSSLAHSLYKKNTITERHRHRYEVNNRYKNRLEKAGMVISGVNDSLGVVETIEISGHPWFVAGQFHPELKSRVNKAHPLFREFIKASKKYNKKRS